MVKRQSFYRCLTFATFCRISQKLVSWSFSKPFMKYGQGGKNHSELGQRGCNVRERTYGGGSVRREACVLGDRGVLDYLHGKFGGNRKDPPIFK